MAEPFEFSDRAGGAHPRHEPGPADPAGPRRARDELPRSCAARWPSSRPSSATRPAACGDQGRAGGGQGAKFATPRRSEITFDIGDLDIEDLIDDEELVVTLSAKGYVKTVAADSFRAQGRGGRGVAGAKPPRRRLRQPHPPHHRPRLPAVLLQPGPGLPAQGPRDPDEGPHGAGHRHRQPAAAAAGRAHPGRSSTPATTRPTGSCSSPPSRDRSRRPSSTSTTRRCAAGSSPSTSATATSW